MEPLFFKTPAQFRAWLEKYHTSRTEQWVGFYKAGTGKASMTWPESVDQALCFGWIDGLRKGLDDERYMIRFTPRKPGSIWSKINIAKIAALKKAGLLGAAGARAYAARRDSHSGVYSFEQEKHPEFDAASLKILKAGESGRVGWKWFESQPAGYRKQATWWVMSAKKPETKVKRLEQLAADNANQKRLRHTVWEKKPD